MATALANLVTNLSATLLLVPISRRSARPPSWPP